MESDKIVEAGIIGAGISGLTVAYHLQKRGISYILTDKNQLPGGYIQSFRQGNYLFEKGPNSLLADEHLLSFLSEIGLDTEILPANEVSKNRYIYKNGGYKALPSGPLSLLFGDFFSWKTKLAVFRERNNKTHSPENETLGDFFERRFSKEIVEYALDPFIAGIYAGNPYDLLVGQTFPNLLEFEQKHGSVLKGFIKQGAAKRRKSVSFKDGLHTFPAFLSRKITNLLLGTEITDIQKTDSGYQLFTPTENFTVKKLIITCEAPATARLLSKLYPSFAEKLQQIQYASMVAVHSVYKKSNLKHNLNGFGGLNPAIEGLFTLGSIWSSAVFQYRCPDDEVLFTTFVGGIKAPEKTKLSDEVIKQKVHQELSGNFLLQNTTPVLQNIFRWEQALPQYNLLAQAAQKEADLLQKDNIYFSANWKDGVSLSDCVKKSEKLAQSF
jgi:oxygen-dependent protoporphyrinogen oxidase